VFGGVEDGLIQGGCELGLSPAGQNIMTDILIPSPPAYGLA